MNEQKELLWDKYKHEIETFRAYLDFIIKLNASYYAITGAILSFYFLNFKSSPELKWSLLLPIIMSFALAVFCYKGAGMAKISQADFEDIAEQLGFRVYSGIGHVLVFLLWISFFFFSISFLGLIVFLFKGSVLEIWECLNVR